MCHFDLFLFPTSNNEIRTGRIKINENKHCDHHNVFFDRKLAENYMKGVK